MKDFDRWLKDLGRRVKRPCVVSFVVSAEGVEFLFCMDKDFWLRFFDLVADSGEFDSAGREDLERLRKRGSASLWGEMDYVG